MKKTTSNSSFSSMSRRRFLAASAASVAGALLARAPSVVARTPQPSRTGHTPALQDVIVIGAGLAGLNATLLLEEMGFSVTLLEGRDRVGGRVFSMDDVPGSPEGGAEGIGANYGRLLHSISKYQVPLHGLRDTDDGKRLVMNVRGENIPLAKWGSSALNPMPRPYREALPSRVPWEFFGQDNPLRSAADFVNPEYAAYDISLYQYLKRKGFEDRAIELMSNISQPTYGDVQGSHGLSMLLIYNDVCFLEDNLSTAKAAGVDIVYSAKGGNMRIPEAMARHVKTEIRFNRRVIGIRDEKGHAEVHLSDGQILKAKRVIVTMPFSALRLVHLDAPITPRQSLAIATLGYTKITHLSFVIKRNFWESDGMDPAMWTDGLAGQLQATRNNPNNPAEITGFRSFAVGANANYLDRLGPKGAAAEVLSYLARIRPSTKNALECVKFWSWQLDPFAGGSYASWEPGQVTAYGKDMGAAAGRIHFAGEHTSIVTRGMEAAMESGERVAFEVSNAL